MTDEHDLTDQLDRLGASQTPPVDPAFADRLEAQLRVRHAEQVSIGTGRSPWWRPLAGLAGVLGVVVLAAVSLTLLRPDESVVVMTAAAATDVVLPGETATPGAAGLELPDGTRIVVAAGGEAVVGGVVLGPGSEALVVGGRIEVLGAPDRETDPGDAGPTTSTPVVSVAPTTASDRPADDGGATGGSTDGDGARDPVGDPTTTTAPPTDSSSTTETTAGPEPDREPTTSTNRATTTTSASAPSRPSTTVGRTTTSTTVSTTAPTSTRPAVDPSLELTVEATTPDRLVLTWELAGTDDPGSWRIEAQRGDRVVTLVVLRDGSARTTTVARIDARGVGFRVVAVDERGDDLLTSEVVAQPAAP